MTRCGVPHTLWGTRGRVGGVSVRGGNLVGPSWPDTGATSRIGFDALVSSATGLARETVRKGRREIARGEPPTSRIRAPGAGRPGIEQDQPGVLAALEALVDPLTRGDPTSPLRWTCKSRTKLAAALSEQGWRVSSTTVGRLLHRLGYRLQSVRKRQEGTVHPDRNEQVEHINATAERFLNTRQPVISVDTKKKELVGNFPYGIAFPPRRSGNRARAPPAASPSLPFPTRIRWETGLILRLQAATVRRCRSMSIESGWSRGPVLGPVEADRRTQDTGDVLSWFESAGEDVRHRVLGGGFLGERPRRKRSRACAIRC